MRIVPPKKYPDATDETKYRDGNPTSQLLGSWVPAEFFNSINAEIVGAITAAGLTPSISDLTQLWQAMQAAAAGAVSPSGVVQAYAGAAAPTGWLECNGGAVSRTVYSGLFAAIGTTYGYGDGSGTFNLPDLRGEFIRGWDHGRGEDADRDLGSWQADELRSHSHTNTTQRFENATNVQSDLLITLPGDTSESLETSATGGDETRPRNVAMMYIIKI